MTQRLIPQTRLPSFRQKRVVPAELEGDSSWTGFQDEPLASGLHLASCLLNMKERGKPATYTFLFTCG